MAWHGIAWHCGAHDSFSSQTTQKALDNARPALPRGLCDGVAPGQGKAGEVLHLPRRLWLLAVQPGREGGSRRAGLGEREEGQGKLLPRCLCLCLRSNRRQGAAAKTQRELPPTALPRGRGRRAQVRARVPPALPGRRRLQWLHAMSRVSSTLCVSAGRETKRKKTRWIGPREIAVLTKKRKECAPSWWSRGGGGGGSGERGPGERVRATSGLRSDRNLDHFTVAEPPVARACRSHAGLVQARRGSKRVPQDHRVRRVSEKGEEVAATARHCHRGAGDQLCGVPR